MRERWPAAKQSAIVATPLHEELVAQRARPAAAGVRRRGTRPAGGLRERRESRARACDGPRPRVRRTRRARLEPVPARSPAPGREPGAGGPRRPGRTRSWRVAAFACCRCSVSEALPRLDEVGLNARRAGLCAGRDSGDCRGLRRRPGSPPGGDVAGRSAAPAVALRDRHAGPGAAARRAGCSAGGAGADAARGRGCAPRELPSTAAGGSRHSRRRRPHLRGEPADEPLRRRRAGRLSRRSWRAGSRRSPA